MRQVETPCKPCKGTGKCRKCDGRGIAEVGFLSKKIVDCPDCAASGKCRDCGGSGKRIVPVPEGNESVWEVMQKQAESARQKDNDLREREAALKSRGIDPRSPEFEPIRTKHFAGNPQERKGQSAEGDIWDVMAKQAAHQQQMRDFLSEIEEIARQRGV